MSKCKQCVSEQVCRFNDGHNLYCKENYECPHYKSNTDIKQAEWKLDVHSFYNDNWDESIELVVYILAHCSNCGKEHFPKQVFSKRIEAPEDADENFRFDQEYEKAKALEEFKQKNRKFINYCSNCGAEMIKYE